MHELVDKTNRQALIRAFVQMNKNVVDAADAETIVAGQGGQDVVAPVLNNAATCQPCAWGTRSVWHIGKHLLPDLY